MTVSFAGWPIARNVAIQDLTPDPAVGGWYGLKKGLRGRFGVYIAPLMEELGLCELEHNAKNNRMRAR